MDITGTLAKLLATENLTIIHKPGAPTASFNVEQRVLTLPVITDASQEVLLRCGKSSIELCRDGKILIRGSHVVTRSSGPNKIKGASISLN